MRLAAAGAKQQEQGEKRGSHAVSIERYGATADADYMISERLSFDKGVLLEVALPKRIPLCKQRRLKTISFSPVQASCFLAVLFGRTSLFILQRKRRGAWRQVLLAADPDGGALRDTGCTLEMPGVAWVVAPQKSQAQ